CCDPFIRASASPLLTSATAAWDDEAGSSGASTSGTFDRSTPIQVSQVSIRLRGPTRIGSIIPCDDASQTAARESAEQGYATATFRGLRPQAAVSRSVRPRNAGVSIDI